MPTALREAALAAVADRLNAELPGVVLERARRAAVDTDTEDLPRLVLASTDWEADETAEPGSTHYTLAYDYTHAPTRLKWELVKGDIMRAVDGEYVFTPTSPTTCDVSYDLSIELVVPIPGFVKRRAEVRILSTLEELKARAEA